MKSEDFESIKYFTEQEVLATGAKLVDVERTLIGRLDLLRAKLGCPIGLNSLTTGRHVTQSYHYQGVAADIRIPITMKPAAHVVVQAAIDIGFRGIGVYTWGFHVDLRENCALWKRVDGNYLPLI